MPSHYTAKYGLIRFAFMSLIVCLMLDAGVTNAGNKEAAKVKFEAGVAWFEDGNYKDALAAFEDSYRLIPKTSVLFNIGMCQKALYHFADALATFQKYLETGGDKITEEKRKTVDAAVLEMQKLVGTLEVQGAPDGATVYVDGRLVGTCPMKAPAVIDPGQHLVKVSKEGFGAMETKVTVAAEAKSTVHALLEPSKGKIVIKCTKEGAVVRVNNVVMGGGCPFEGTVSPGTHAVSVAAKGMVTYEGEVTVAPGDRAELVVSLIPRPDETKPEPLGEAASKDNKEVATKEVVTSDASEKRRLVIIAGAVGTALGVGLASVGAVFNARAADEHDTASKAATIMETEVDSNVYDANSQKYNTAEDNLRTANTLMYVGYAAGGALVAAGVSLFVVGLKKRKKDEQAAVFYDGSQLYVRF